VTVDAIIVNWNGGDELLVAIESARRFGANVIVVDNASEFGVARGLGAHPDVTLIRSPRNLGFAAGCNLGAAAGSAGIVLLLNPDAEIVAGSAADLEQAFESSSGVIIGLPLEHTSGRSLRTSYPLPGARQLLADLFRLHSMRRRLGMDPPLQPAVDDVVTRVGWIVGSALAMRRTDWQRLGGLDDGFFLWYEDVDLGARAAKTGGTIDVAGGILVRHGGASSWSRLSRRRRQWLRIAGTHRYAARHLGRGAAAAIVAAAPAAVLAGVALDVAHWLARRP